jgi:hypothetical protein
LPKVASNAIEFANPFYPFAFHVGALQFAGAEPTSQPNMISSAWADTPRALRWLASVIEFDAFRGRALPWLIGQGDVPQSSPSFRMGGYFVAYVLGALALLGWSARVAPRARYAAALTIGLTALCMALPNASELRYYLFWMMSLVCFVLACGHAPALAGADQPWRRRASHALVAITAATVVSMTGGAFVKSRGFKLHDVLAEASATIATIPDGATVCVLNFDRRAFLYAPVLHPGRRYRVRQLIGDEADPSCTVRVRVSHGGG